MSEPVILEKRLYTAHATATHGRDGRVLSDDGQLDLAVAPPKAMGGNGAGTNPEQLFAAGYAACFGSALALVARKQRLETGPVAITAHVSIGAAGAGYGLAVELEAAILGVDGVAEVAVIPAPDPRFGETPAAVVVPGPGRDDVDELAVIGHCERVLADYKIPRYVVIRSAPLPRLPSGKIAKRLVRDEYRDVAERFARAR